MPTPHRTHLPAALFLAVSLLLPTGAALAEDGPALTAPPPPKVPVWQSAPGGGAAGGTIVPPPLRYLPAPPREMTLCGEQVPLGERDVAEMLDREFNLMVNDQAQVVMWLKRASRYFPYIESRLKAEGLPDDLKFVAVVESSLLTRVTSPVGAMGPWQFMDATGRRYGLRKDLYFDDRRNPEKATSAAIAYMKDLYRMFGSWTLAMAAYNCGERRVQNELADQGVNSYYDLFLPQETMRYVFRVLAAKVILQNPEAYGYQLPAEQLYRPLVADEAALRLADGLHLRTLAQACSTTVKTLREINPELASNTLPKGDVRIKVPQGQGDGLMERLASARPAEEPPLPVATAPVQATLPKQVAGPAMHPAVPARAPSPAAASQAKAPAVKAQAKAKPAKKVWVVKSGQTLSTIASASGARVEEIKKANGLKSASLKIGQKLIIP